MILEKSARVIFTVELCYNIAIMDSEKRARRQSIRLIISETVMVFAVVAMVVVLAFLVSGYWLGSGFQVERQGMLQISSVPIGATVAVDGEAPWYQRTNTSKVLTSGEHTVSLTKEGYDSWNRTVNIRDGLLYRVNYPRLFLLEREKEVVYNGSTATLATISPDHKWMLVANNTTTWRLLNLNSDKVESKTISVATLFDAVSMASGATTGLFMGEITELSWSEDNDHVLVKSRLDNKDEWALLNIKNPTESVNITRQFATSFDEVRIFDNSASILLAVKDSNLHKIDVPGRQVSAVLVEEIQSFDVFGSEIIFTAAVDAKSAYDSSDEILRQEEETLEEVAPAPNYYTGVVKLNDSERVSYITSSQEPIRAFISRFYDEKYITIITDAMISVYKYDGTEAIFEGALNFNPDNVKVGHDGSFVFMNSGDQAITLDMEALELRNWTLDTESYGWLDGHIVYSVKDGTLIVYDFDGLNRRTLSNNVSAHFPVTITENKWLYYFSDDKLVREVIVQ